MQVKLESFLATVFEGLKHQEILKETVPMIHSFVES
jgi:hypothetical protein